MRRSERINRWFAIMQMLEKQNAAVDKIHHNSTAEVFALKVQIRKAVIMVDAILSETYNT